MSNQPIEIDDGLTTFKIGDRLFSLDLVAALERIDAAEKAKTDTFDHLSVAIEIVAEAAEGLLLNRSQADRFVDTARATWCAQKKSFWQNMQSQPG